MKHITVVLDNTIEVLEKGLKTEKIEEKDSFFREALYMLLNEINIKNIK